MRLVPARVIVGAVLVLVLVACPSTGGGVSSVTIDGGDRNVAVGDTRSLTATVVATVGVDRDVTWRSSDEDVATIDATGTALGRGVGTADITATSVVDATKSDTITLTVDPPGVVRWTRQFGTGTADAVHGIATDAIGSVYLVGDTLAALEGAHEGDSDAFVRAYGRTGEILWTRQFGTSGEDRARGVATDGDGNVYVAGYTSGALEGANAGTFDAFVRAYDADGVFRWGRQFGTGGEDVATAVATDTSGNVYVVGSTSGALEGSNAGGLDAFVRSYDANGVFRWTRQFGTGGADEATGIVIDANDNVYVAGYVQGLLEGAYAGAIDAFVRSYDSGGEIRWTRQFGTGSWDYAEGVAADASGNVYVVGSTEGSLEALGVNAGLEDAFVRSYDGGGALRWTRQFGTGGVDVAYGVTTDTAGRVYVTGYTTGALEGAGAGGSDAFVRAFDGSGDLRWTRQFGTGGADVANGIATDAEGDVYVAGRTGGSLEGVNVGGDDAFVRAYGP